MVRCSIKEHNNNEVIPPVIVQCMTYLRENGKSHYFGENGI